MKADADTSAVAAQSARPGRRGGKLRQVCDWLACLAVAATLVRHFQVEGYIISTGSMAPNLLGFHKRVVCPSCHYLFPFGVTKRTPADDPPIATCPNCNRHGIHVENVPRNEGDQLLVHKNAFAIRPLRRWEILVFQNPDRPSQAYVKRVVGLPNERIQVIAGDVYIDGQIQRKRLKEQRDIRIIVDDDRFRPTDAFWKSRWDPDPGWQMTETGFLFEPAQTTASGNIARPAWIQYHNWIRSGGTHWTAIQVDSWPNEVASPDAVFSAIAYDRPTRQLECHGVMVPEDRDRLLDQVESNEARTALVKLERLSHLAPITDNYGYNRETSAIPAVVVRDLMLVADVTIEDGTGELVSRQTQEFGLSKLQVATTERVTEKATPTKCFDKALVIGMTDGRRQYHCLFDFQTREIRLLIDSATESVRHASFPDCVGQKTFHLEMSTFDRQVVIAIDGAVLFPPWLDEIATNRPISPDRLSSAETQALRSPVRLGAHALRCRVDNLQLYRDVYYRSDRTRWATTEPYKLGADEYFVMGDNSPISLDSRCWAHPAVKKSMILGKPFLVHLPSRQGKIRVGNWFAHFRIPDFSRIRYIH